MDANQFKQLVMPRYRRMYMLALRLTSDSRDAEDAVQDAVTRLWQNRSKLADSDNPDAYITTVVRNAAIDTINHRRPSVNIEEAGNLAHESDPSEALERSERVKIIMSIINDLPETQQQVIMMKDVYGYDFDEIERATGCNYGHLRVLLSRARKTIKNHFTDTAI
ncbi:MAG: sigma-70 family RNA polymerase sigma factor [Muribaculaceae bacterium]|nr:sigma-70 family RNA polymerase sigma factor [Muribaculaceae bacterium]